MAWFKDSVDKITADFDSVKTRLESHAISMLDEQKKHLANVEAYAARAEAAFKEATRASSIAAKIKELLK